MAQPRANLTLTEDVKSAFLAAQSGSTRAVYLVIKPASESIELHSSALVDAVGTPEEDFQALIARAKEEAITTALYRLAETSWALVSVVSDAAPPVQKMLSSSSRADIKDGLGGSFFIADQFASSWDELDFANFAKKTASEAKESMTSEELFIKNTVRESEAARGTRTEAMAAMPFELDDSATEGVQGFVEGKSQFVEMFLSRETEKVTLVSASADADAAALSSKLPAKEPRYCLFRRATAAAGDSKEGEAVFVFYSPDGANLVFKMMHATAKGTVMQNISSIPGMPAIRSCDVHSAAEFAEELAPAAAAAPKEEDSILGGAARPAGPGRGKRRLIRKK